MTAEQHAVGGSTTIDLLTQSLSSEKDLQVLETHISWIVLFDQTALKLKKPLANPFLDYSTLALRRQACFAEIRLNRRYAPQLYQNVVAIVQDSSQATHNLRLVELSSDSPSTDANATSGPILDYAVRMHRFHADALLAHRLHKDLVPLSAIEQLAKTIAAFHQSAEPSHDSQSWGSPQTIIKDAFDNLDFLDSSSLIDQPDTLQHLRHWTTDTSHRLHEAFQLRQQQGMIRECHGDLHLENIIAWQEQLIPFDGIEFSEHLRWIDIQNDAAFTSMDLMFHNHRQHAARFTNSYLEHTGDYQGLAVLRWYQVYRALVRAKVTLLRAQQENEESAKQQDISKALEFLQLAERLSQPTQPKLMITYGLSGSGKTYGTQHLVDDTAAIRIRSDVQRKKQPNTPHQTPLYSQSAKQTIYHQLLNLAQQTLTAGYDTIIDATFLSSTNRALFRSLAQRLNVPFQILEFDADFDTLRQRILQRQSIGEDASDADLTVLQQQIETREPLRESEQPHVIKMPNFSLQP